MSGNPQPLIELTAKAEIRDFYPDPEGVVVGFVRRRLDVPLEERVETVELFDYPTDYRATLTLEFDKPVTAEQVARDFYFLAKEQIEGVEEPKPLEEGGKVYRLTNGGNDLKLNVRPIGRKDTKSSRRFEITCNFRDSPDLFLMYAGMLGVKEAKVNGKRYYTRDYVETKPLIDIVEGAEVAYNDEVDEEGFGAELDLKVRFTKPLTPEEVAEDFYQYARHYIPDLKKDSGPRPVFHIGDSKKSIGFTTEPSPAYKTAKTISIDTECTEARDVFLAYARERLGLRQVQFNGKRMYTKDVKPKVLDINSRSQSNIL